MAVKHAGRLPLTQLRPWLLVATALVTLGAVLGFLVVGLGLVPIAASSGHFAVTEWFLQFAKQRAVATHARRGQVPALDAPWLLEKGAAHFHGGCRPCHGAPDLARQPSVARAMLPPPPRLSARAPEWQPEELFYIVKHGIKFTGMPAWPAQVRDDEVLAVTRFVRELPRLDAEGYRALALGSATPAADAEPLAGEELEESRRTLIASCARCHGARGEGRSSAAFPVLARQKREYLAASLEAYARDARPSGIMQPIAAALDAEQIRALAGFYAQAPRRSTVTSAAAREAIERGRGIAENGVSERRVPSCADCHGPATERLSSDMPELAGQRADYIVLQLDLFARGVRGGTEHAHLMDEVAPHMNEAEKRDVAAYYASLEPRVPPR